MPEDTRYGFPRTDWERAKHEAKEYLVSCARRRMTTTYSDLCGVVSSVRIRPYSFAMMAFLNEVCTEEDAAHGVMLASLVCRKDTALPGAGYFRHAARLGRDTADERAYWESEIARIYAAFPPEGSDT